MKNKYIPLDDTGEAFGLPTRPVLPSLDEIERQKEDMLRRQEDEYWKHNPDGPWGDGWDPWRGTWRW